MRKLAFLSYGDLQEDGTFFFESQAELRQTIRALKKNYNITLIVPPVCKAGALNVLDLGCTLIYDTSGPGSTPEGKVPSHTQINYEKWAEGEVIDDENLFDCVIVWGGFSPWSIASALWRVRAKRRLLWVLHKPSLYLLDEDREFYNKVCMAFDCVLMAREEIQRDFAENYLQDEFPICVLYPPTDWEQYIRLSKEKVEELDAPEDIRLLAEGRMEIENALEKIPCFAAEYRKQYPDLHWYILGEGKRLPHFWQQIAFYDVDSQVTLLGKKRNPFPFLTQCDALVICSEETSGDLISAASIFDIPVISVKEIENKAVTFKKRTKSDQCIEIFKWKDLGKIIYWIEGENV